MQSKLKITGLTEQIRWLKSDSKSGWFAYIGIEGLVPALVAGGYAYVYTLDLIPPEGEVVRSSLSQDPEGFETSTSVRIGGMGLPPGKYTVKVSCEVDEDTFALDVPDSSVILPEIKKKQEAVVMIKKITNTKNKQLNIVKEIHLQNVDDSVLLTVQRNDDTGYSLIMNDRSMSQVEISGATIDKIGMFMHKSRDQILKIADEYVTQDRKESSFFNDVITLANAVSELSTESHYLLDVGDTTELLHNRIVAQLLNYYNQVGCKISPRPIVHDKNSRRHDFHVEGLKCEVKTIQTIGEIEMTHTDGLRFTHKYAEMLIETFKRDLEEAKEQLDEKGMIFIAPSSYKLSGIMRQAFDREAIMFPPAPQRDLAVLVLESENAFEDFYVSFPTPHALRQLTMAIYKVQTYGIKGSIFPMIRKGMPMRLTTAAKPGSTIGYTFKVWGSQKP